MSLTAEIRRGVQDVVSYNPYVVLFDKTRAGLTAKVNKYIEENPLPSTDEYFDIEIHDHKGMIMEHYMRVGDGEFRD